MGIIYMIIALCLHTYYNKCSSTLQTAEAITLFSVKFRVVLITCNSSTMQITILETIHAAKSAHDNDIKNIYVCGSVHSLTNRHDYLRYHRVEYRMTRRS